MSYETDLQAQVQPDFAELYDFSVAGEHWRHTSYQMDVDFLGETYLAAEGLKRKEWSNEVDLRPVQVNITVPISRFAAQFVANYPVPPLRVEIIRWFLHDAGSYYRIFSGEAKSVVVTKLGAEIAFESASLLFSALVPNVVHQAGCNHVLFGPGCKLDEYSYRVPAEGVTVAGKTIVSAAFAAFPDDYLSWGRVKTANNDHRMITGHIGNTIEIHTAFSPDSLQSGGDVIAWPGCSKSRAVCQAKYGNFSNFLGMPFIPSHNPAIYGIETGDV